MTNNGQLPDVLTYAGNGEPTTHPDFLEIVKDTIELRNKYCPEAKVSVLSNATLIERTDVFEALQLVDNNILKLDTVDPEYIKTVNRPTGAYSVDKVLDRMKQFNGHCIIQTMFMHGTIEDRNAGNVNEKFITPWLRAIVAVKPQQVMIYTIDRETPDHSLRKAVPEELDRIVRRIEALGIHATASY